MSHYPRAPITEAVIELRFSPKVENDRVDKAAQKLSSRYAFREKIAQHSFTFQVAAGAAEAKVEVEGVKFSSIDRTEVTMVKTDAFLCSRLAPYTQWEDLYKRAIADWSDVRRVLENPVIGRIGVRFINRIDVPGALKGHIDPNNYVNVGIHMPKLEWGPISSYLLQATRPITEKGPIVLIHSGIIPSPLIGHLSILLDIDLSTEKEIPRDDDQVWKMIDSFRDIKNKVFEASITDEARKLFS